MSDDLESRVGKILWANMDDQSPKPYLCIRLNDSRLENSGARALVRLIVTVAPFPTKEFEDLDMTMLDLTTGRLGQHTRFAHQSLSTAYTVLRGDQTMQEGTDR